MGRIALVEIDFLPLEGSPEPFSEDIVDGSPFAIHTDPDVSGEEAFQIAATGEMAPLVTVENRGDHGFKGPVHTSEVPEDADARIGEKMVEISGEGLRPDLSRASGIRSPAV